MSNATYATEGSGKISISRQRLPRSFSLPNPSQDLGCGAGVFAFGEHAVAWIPSHQTLRDHRKVKRAARLLNISIPTLIGHLHLLWWWALDQAPDGDVTICDALDLAEAALFDGDPDLLIQSLVDCGGKDGFGFLERTEEGRLVIHDWADFGGRYLVKKEQTRERVTRYRARCNALVTQEKRVSNANVTHLEEIREDKNREEKRVKVVSATPARQKFSVPEKAEVAAFFVEIGSNKPTAREFFDHYTANGWKVGRNPMVDWKAAARNWTRRDFSNNGHSDRSVGEVQSDVMAQRGEEAVNRAKRQEGDVPVTDFVKSVAAKIRGL